MTIVKSIIRITIILSLVGVALVLTFAEELDTDLHIWIAHALADKAIAALSYVAAYRLCKRWKEDPVFDALFGDDNEGAKI